MRLSFPSATNRLRALRKRGFSLVETMVAMSIGVAVGGAAIWFLVEGTRMTLRANSSTINDLVQWSISSRLQLDTKVANGATIFRSLSDADLTETARRRGGERGNVLILSLSNRTNNATRSYYVRIVGYVYNPTTRILSKFDHTVATSEQSPPVDLETIIKTHRDSFTYIPIGREIDTLDTDGPFVCRDIGNINAATATFQLNQGKQSMWTSDRQLIEVSFMIRG